jgi:hypothetical protein
MVTLVSSGPGWCATTRDPSGTLIVGQGAEQCLAAGDDLALQGGADRLALGCGFYRVYGASLAVPGGSADAETGEQ